MGKQWERDLLAAGWTVQYRGGGGVSYSKPQDREMVDAMAEASRTGPGLLTNRWSSRRSLFSYSVWGNWPHWIYFALNMLTLAVGVVVLLVAYG